MEEGRGGWSGGREGGVGWGWEGWGGKGGVGGVEGGGKPPQEKTRGDYLPTDGPDHTTRLKGHHSGQG